MACLHQPQQTQSRQTGCEKFTHIALLTSRYCCIIIAACEKWENIPHQTWFIGWRLSRASNEFWNFQKKNVRIISSLSHTACLYILTSGRCVSDATLFLQVIQASRKTCRVRWDQLRIVRWSQGEGSLYRPFPLRLYFPAHLPSPQK